MPPGLPKVSPKDQYHPGKGVGEAFPGKMSSERDTPRLRAILIGELRKVGETVSWEGHWSMDESQFENSEITLDKFSYERTALLEPAKEEKVENELLQDGYFSGHFFTRRQGESGMSPRTTKHLEKDLLFRFSKDVGSSDVFTVSGAGQNKFGKFQLSGTFTVSTGVLRVCRDYSPRRISRNRKANLIRVAKELGLDREKSCADLRNTLQKSDSIDASLTEKTRAKVQRFLEKLMKLDADQWFCSPVNAEELGLLDYREIIKTPMDLGTVMENLCNEKYNTVQEVHADIQLTFDNAIHYNSRGHPVYRKATELLQLFTQEFESRFLKKHNAKHNGDDHALETIAQSVSKIGKRVRTPKVTYEPDTGPSIKRIRSSANVVSQAEEERTRASRKRSTSPRRKSAIGIDTEILRLRKEVKILSSNLARMGSAMLQESQFVQEQKPVARQRKVKKLTVAEKRKLGADILSLPGHKINKVIEIIQNNGDSLAQAEGDDVEVDIEILSYSTVKKLKAYVARNRRR